MPHNDENSLQSKKINLGSEKLKIFFIRHLNRIYAAKLHLIAQLPKLANEVYFDDLGRTITDTVDNVEKQIARMELIYALLDLEVAHGSIHGLTGFIDDAFESINEQEGESELRDMSIIFYLQNIESVEMASFQILQMAAVKLKNQQIDQLLKENYDDAKSTRTLLLLVSAKYITN